ncbi:hypothetical protein [Phycicoccus avicenniae]|uniref:hypothetical protein n=1 Tax=Phycicoccus avicenniae TaxID=2828860 RepID=UPI003D2D74F5
MSAQFNRPSGPPTQASSSVQTQWQQLTVQSLPRVRESATKWRDGLAALVTLITAGLVVSGPEKVSDVDEAWRPWLTGTLIGGLVATTVGLLFALRAVAGQPKALTFEEFADKWGSQNALAAADAERARRDLRWAARFAVPGLFALIAGVGLWLLSPTGSATSAVEVTSSTERLCGELKSADDQQVRLTVDGESKVTEVKFADVQNMRLVKECDTGRQTR